VKEKSGHQESNNLLESNPFVICFPKITSKKLSHLATNFTKNATGAKRRF